ncbi:MAG TPA: 16S rRNA (guanine(527)-N(7))-methyltransferase RsmG [bacterium]|jgi:16S rRNA (guanine527-N7)-methyltransferase
MLEILKIPNVDNDNFQRLCQAYIDLLSYWNSIINLVSTKDVDKLLTDLVSQSTAPLALMEVPQGAKMLDIGSGAGIPALPLKFARQDLQVTLLEPRRQKSLFLKRVVQELNLADVEVVRDRIEFAGARPEWRGVFDLITTRGTGSASKLLPFIEPLMRPGGAFWAFKGMAGRRELREIQGFGKYRARLLELEKNLSLLVVDF